MSVGLCQAGIWKDLATSKHMLTFCDVSLERISRNRKFYNAFIDFEKAFDCESRTLLWSTLFTWKIKLCLQNTREMVLMSETVTGLQNQRDVFQKHQELIA